MKVFSQSVERAVVSRRSLYKFISVRKREERKEEKKEQVNRELRRRGRVVRGRRGKRTRENKRKNERTNILECTSGHNSEIICT